MNERRNGMRRRMPRRALIYQEHTFFYWTRFRTANGCYKDAADLRADLDDFLDAISLYEKVAEHSLTSPLTRYSVKEYWLKSLLCGLAAKVEFISMSNKAPSPIFI